MSKKRLRISIVCVLTALALATYGCGGGGGSGPAAGGGFIPAVVPDAGEEPSASGQTAEATQQLSDNAKQLSDNANQENQEQNRVNRTLGSEQPLYTWLTHFTDREHPKTVTRVEFAEEDYPLTWDHDVPVGRYYFQPGQIRLHGNLMMTCPFGEAYSSCVVLFEPDGSVHYMGSPESAEITGLGVPGFTLFPPRGFPDVSLPPVAESKQAPVFDYGPDLFRGFSEAGPLMHVGAGVAPEADDLTAGADRNGVSISHGNVQDGVSAVSVLEFMERQVTKEGGNLPPGLETYSSPPTIRLLQGTSDLYAGFATRAVQLINSALPADKRIAISPDPIQSQDQLSAGEIYLEFSSLSTPGALGVTDRGVNTQFNSQTQQEEVQNLENAGVIINERELRKAVVFHLTPYPHTNESYLTTFEEYWDVEYPVNRPKNSDTHIKYYDDQIFLSVVAHGLMRALGFYHTDPDENAQSILHPRVDYATEKGEDRRDGNKVYSPFLPLNKSIIFLDGAVSVNSHQGRSNTNVQTTDKNAGASIKLTASESAGGTALSVETRNNAAQTPYSEDQLGSVTVPKARTIPGHVLFPLDRALLLAAYARFSPGAQPGELTAENLGEWSDTSFHLRGAVDFTVGQASFGVASTNGLDQPWASGPTPWTNLADNQSLSGNVTWNGALLGVASSSETVAGDAALTVDLTDLTGRIDFTGMEQWGAGEAPGASGSGEAWGDGDLGYTLAVRGNTFVQTGGDDGYVTGAFFGAAHEAMGGVLERADLSAAFGGKR